MWNELGNVHPVPDYDWCGDCESIFSTSKYQELPVRERCFERDALSLFQWINGQAFSVNIATLHEKKKTWWTNCVEINIVGTWRHDKKQKWWEARWKITASVNTNCQNALQWLQLQCSSSHFITEYVKCFRSRVRKIGTFQAFKKPSFQNVCSECRESMKVFLSL